MGEPKLNQVTWKHAWKSHLPDLENTPLPLCVVSIPNYLSKTLNHIDISDPNYMTVADLIADVAQNIRIISSSSLLKNSLGRGSSQGLLTSLRSMLKFASIDHGLAFVNSFQRGDNLKSCFCILNQNTKIAWSIKVQDSRQQNNQIQYLLMIEDVSESYHDQHIQDKVLKTVDQLEDFCAVFNINGEIDFLNQTAKNFLCLETPNQLVRFTDILSDKSSSEIARAATGLSQNALAWHGKIEVLTHKGEKNHLMNATLSLLKSEEDPSMTGFVLTCRRATELESLQLELMSRDQLIDGVGNLVTIGMVASQVFDEIRRPITDIASLLQNYDSETIKKEIFPQAKKVEKIIQSAKSLSNPHASTKNQHSSLRTIFDDVRQLMELSARTDGIEIRFPEISLDVFINMDSIPLTLTFINLISNACDAVRDLSEKWVEVNVAMDLQSITVMVVDSGDGIPSSIAERIFDGFFTTKESGKGTGMGLYISRRVINRFGGDLSLDTLAPHTTFVVKIPRLQNGNDSYLISTSNDEWEEI